MTAIPTLGYWDIRVLAEFYKIFDINLIFQIMDIWFLGIKSYIQYLSK
jgi:hypothetical protein